MNTNTVLVVEDDLAIRALLTDVLQSEGYMVRAAPTGADALREAVSDPPGVMVLDLMLPDMTGRTVAELCYLQTAEIPILLMSASPNLWRTAEQLGRYGVRGFISKPFDLGMFLAAVQRLTADSAVKKLDSAHDRAGLAARFRPLNPLADTA